MISEQLWLEFNRSLAPVNECFFQVDNNAYNLSVCTFGAALNRGALPAFRAESLKAAFGYPSRHTGEEESIWLTYKFELSRGRPWLWMHP